MSKSDVNGVLKSKTGIFRGEITILETSEVRSEVTQALCSERFRENDQILTSGGERGIRTPDTLLAYTRFPGGPLQPLGHLSDQISLSNTNQKSIFKACTSSLEIRQNSFKMDKAI